MYSNSIVSRSGGCPRTGQPRGPKVAVVLLRNPISSSYAELNAAELLIGYQTCLFLRLQHGTLYEINFFPAREFRGRMADRITEVEQSLEILVPDDWSADQRGKFFESFAATLLARQSYEIVERVAYTGMEIDLLARHKPSGGQIYVECKFLSSAVGANVIDLIIGQSFRRKIRQVALFSAGPLAKGANGAVLDLKDDDRISFAHYGPTMLLQTVIDAGLAPRLDLVNLPANISHATLLVYPDYPYTWLLQEQSDGRPHRIIPQCLSLIHI